MSNTNDKNKISHDCADLFTKINDQKAAAVCGGIGNSLLGGLFSGLSGGSGGSSSTSSSNDSSGFRLPII